MPLAKHGQEVVNHLADLGDVDFDVDVGGRTQGQHDVVGPRRVLHEPGGFEPSARAHLLEQRLSARFGKGHLSGVELLEHGRLPLDPDHVKTTGGERESQRQADPAESDHGNGFGHRAESRTPSAQPCTAWQKPPRSGG